MNLHLFVHAFTLSCIFFTEKYHENATRKRNDITKTQTTTGIKFEEDICFTHFFINIFVAQGPGICCAPKSDTKSLYFHCHRASCSLCRCGGGLVGCLLGGITDCMMHALYPCGACMFGCECCKFKDCDQCTTYPGKYHAYWERVECEKEWRYVERTVTDNDGHTRRAHVKEKHTIRSTVLDSKTSDSYEIKSGCHFFRVLCCEYSNMAEPYTFCPECGEPGSDCAHCEFC